jgi:hypothetical protein
LGHVNHLADGRFKELLEKYSLPSDMTESDFFPVEPIERNNKTSRNFCNFCHFKDYSAKVVALHRELHSHLELVPPQVKTEPVLEKDDEVIFMEERPPKRSTPLKVIPKKEPAEVDVPLHATVANVDYGIKYYPCCTFTASDADVLFSHILSQHPRNNQQVLLSNELLLYF